MSTSKPLPRPLGVVIPSKNSRPYLEAHVQGLLPWIHLASEVVLVDSFSNDGTVDYLRKNLPHPNIRFYDHPPGLYASWNFGISQIASPYFFMATTGDVMTAEGIHALVSAACELESDVVISKPTFRNQDGQPHEDVIWPIDDIVATFGLTSPRLLKKVEAVLFTAIHPEAAMLGSSASNLYRTDVWKRLPFPTDFGTTGDGAWGFQHAAEISWGVIPGKYSSFLVHPTGASSAEKKSYQASRRPDQVMRDAMKNWQRDGVVTPAEFAQLRWETLIDTLSGFLDAKTAFDRNRHSSYPWSLNPLAWRNRMVRQSSQRKMQSLKKAVLEDCR